MHVEQGFVAVPIQKSGDRTAATLEDRLAVEEPLEIRLAYGPPGQRVHRNLSVTMRTPGDDSDLAAGFLLSEGIIRVASDLEGVRPCGPAVGPRKLHNVVRVELKPDVAVDLKRLERHFYTTSSCGVCGKTSLEALAIGQPPPIDRDRPSIPVDLVHQLPAKLRAAQAVFEQTGGLHAAALFDEAGELLCLREDVGRHNAVDKLIGAQLRANQLPGLNKLLLVSGRASFELLQKALMAGIPLLAAVGAPSSLAVELAERFGMTLLGFVRNGRFNVYSGGWRLR